MPLKYFAFKQTVLQNPSNLGNTSRVITLDGLRGLLALSVVFHHAAIYPHYLRDGLWWTDSRFFANLGPLGVSLFFMITAYLFYARLLAEGGRPDWTRLYLGRLFRIAPIYLFAISVLFVIVAFSSHFALKVTFGPLLREILCWLALGAAPSVDLNGYPDTRHLLAGVTWTLQSEWLFYLSLPLLALATRRARKNCKTHLVMPVLGLALTLVYLAAFKADGFPACIGPFFAGMCCASLQHLKPGSILPDWIASVVVTLALSIAFLACDNLRTASVPSQ